MKKIYSILAGLLLIVTASWPLQSNAQAPHTMTYKLVLRDSENYLLTNMQIDIRIIILQSRQNGKGGMLKHKASKVEVSIFETAGILITRFFSDNGSLPAET